MRPYRWLAIAFSLTPVVNLDSQLARLNLHKNNFLLTAMLIFSSNYEAPLSSTFETKSVVLTVWGSISAGVSCKGTGKHFS